MNSNQNQFVLSGVVEAVPTLGYTPQSAVAVLNVVLVQQRAKENVAAAATVKHQFNVRVYGGKELERAYQAICGRLERKEPCAVMVSGLVLGQEKKSRTTGETYWTPWLCGKEICLSAQ